MMRLVYVFVFIAGFSATFGLNHQWDIAVATEEQIQFLYRNGTLIGIYNHTFKKIKALTYNEVKNELIVSEEDGDKDIIYKISLNHQNSIVPIVQNISDDVKALAIDSVDDILYWTDSLDQRILKFANGQYEQELEFQTEIPYGITADSCRRKIYWTNADYLNSSITRSDFNGSHIEIILKDMFMPSAITIDQGARRIYWTDIGEGIFFRIESAKLDGTDRHLVYEDRHQKPIDIAVDEDYIYWTESLSLTLWRLAKHQAGARPEILAEFKEKPTGVYVKSNDFKNIPECSNLVEAIAQHKEDLIASEITGVHDSLQCLNNGLYVDTDSPRCICTRGHTGPRCEINLCQNYCFNGFCTFSSTGYPKCQCKLGSTGSRCEFEMCSGFCLNGGSCKVNSTNEAVPKCQCRDGFLGSRCEKSVMPKCDCEGGVVVVPNNGAKPYCRCEGMIEATSSPLSDNRNQLKSSLNVMDRVKDPLVLIFMFSTIILILIISVLAIIVYKSRNQRPRIKKRIIVSKNVTPLTCRPNPPTEQCEITIENCCNMNICETPCFEPASLRGYQRTKTEEKKTLLTSMENGEDLY